MISWGPSEHERVLYLKLVTIVFAETENLQHSMQFIPESRRHILKRNVRARID
jgi:hypothetical protein